GLLNVGTTGTFRERPVFRHRDPRVADLTGSKAEAVNPKIARNQNYDNHYADDCEDVHRVFL
ncbi:MAG TPA: hypothetical protein VND87_15635, partial [Stellaceae bacterium]|nr:hypothetical protein [Stellaceae bacterium]